MAQSNPVDTGWHALIAPKQEPIDPEDRNDSGINSGSDLSETEHKENVLYSTPSGAKENINNVPTHFYNMYQSLTPPSSQRLLSPRNINKAFGQKSENMPYQTVLSPQSSPNITSSAYSRPPQRKLDVTYKNDVLESPRSRKSSVGSEEEGYRSENGDHFDESDLKTPKVGAQGKVKSHKCKQCDFTAITKWEFWEHTRIHIRPDRLLSCPKCPFATEHKHHIEYHLNIHSGRKPYKCHQCTYTCVNKSMLRSHEKSHSTVYQFHCSDCNYTSKYCHAFKQHLRKLKHRPGLVLNPDGTPNPSVIIDVYGSRRGPRLKAQGTKLTDETNTTEVNSIEDSLPFALRQMFNPHLLSLPTLPFFPFNASNALTNPFILRNLQQMVKEQNDDVATKEKDEVESRLTTSKSSQHQAQVLDLSKPDTTTRTRCIVQEESSDDEETVMFSNVEVVEEKKKPNEDTTEGVHTCQFCDIIFRDTVLYTMHMGYHGFLNPFHCNMCGEQCSDRISFFLHIARTQHS